MAKLKGPLFSIAAHGTLGKVLTYFTIGAKTRSRYQKKQKDYESTARALSRIKFGVAGSVYKNLTQEQKDELKGYLMY